MTNALFREDSYLKSCPATVTGVTEQGIETDQTVFYALGGGQLGDTGMLTTNNGHELTIADTRLDKETGKHIHIIESPHSLKEGDPVTLTLDWGATLSSYAIS